MTRRNSMRLSQAQADAIFGKLKAKPQPAGTAQMAAWFAGAKESKYGNKKVIYRGETFDSQDELNRYMELRLLEKAGEIAELQRQIAFELLPATSIGGRSMRPIRYVADFVYLKGGVKIVEDRKGCRTREFMLKRRMMKHLLNIEILET